MKVLYGFELDDGTGKDRKVEFAIKRPTRVDKEEADLTYSSHYSKCINRGIVTKAMLANKYTDAGGSVSNTETKRYNSLYMKWLRAEEALVAERDKKRKNKKKVEELENSILDLKEDLVQFYSRQQKLFEHTAESKAEAHVILWYVLMLSHVRWEEDGELEPYFIGETFEDKLTYYDDQEEKAEDFFLKSVEKLTIYVSLYYYNGAIRAEDFKKFEADLDKERELWGDEEEPDSDKAEAENKDKTEEKKVGEKGSGETPEEKPKE
jgi:hypothetical protein